MRVTLDIPRSLALYSDALEGMTRINERLYREAARAGKPLRSIYSGGVRYVREYPGEEDWKHVGRVIADGEGDCEDLSAARAGELRASGDPLARAEIRRVAPNMTHAFVVRGNGVVEDPSRRLGMGRNEDDELGFSWRKVARAITSPKNIATAALPPLAAARAMRGVYSMVGPRRPVPPGRPALPAALRSPPQSRPPTPVMLAPRAAPGAPRAMAPLMTKAFQTKAAATLEAPTPTSPAAVLPAALRPPPQLRKEEMYDPGAPDLDDYDEIVDADDGDPDDEDAVGADPSGSMDVSWSIDRTPTGWKGTIRVPLDAGRCALISRNVKGDGEIAKKQAIQKGLSAASKLLDNPAVKSLIPPQAQMALNIARSKTARNIAKKVSSWF